jgi:hypothetical protein
VGLDPAAHYTVRPQGPDADDADLVTAGGTGSELMDHGIVLRRDSAASSWLLTLEPAN